jgi:hypothetical protein
LLPNRNLHCIAGVIATSARCLSIENSTIVTFNLDRVDPIDCGSISTLDAIIFRGAGDGTVRGTLKSGDATGPIGIDRTANSVTVCAGCE